MNHVVPLALAMSVCLACQSGVIDGIDGIDGGATEQDARANADGSVNSPEGGTLVDGSILDSGHQNTSAIVVLRAGSPIGSRLDLGEAVEGTTGAPLQLVLRNVSDEAFEIGSLEVASGDVNAFAVTPPASMILQPMSEQNFSVAVRPPSVGDFLARIEVRSSIGATRVAAFEVFGRGTLVPINTRKMFVAVGQRVRTVVSEDGMTWTDDQFVPGMMGENDEQYRGVGYGAGIYIAVGGAAAGHIRWTRDGRTWNDVSDNRQWLGGVAYGNGMFVAAGSNGRVIRSVEGMNWTDPSRDLGLHFRAITFGAGRFIAVGDMGRRSVTTDGLSWTITSTGGAGFTSIVYNTDRFVAVGGNGRTAMTLDGGDTWINDVEHGGGTLRGVTYGNGLFVAVGQGRTMTSPDGASWTEHAVTGAPFTGIAFGDGHFVALGFPNRRYHSTDGVDFDPFVEDGNPTLVNLVFGTGQ
jgi:hypothetical protein